MYEKLRFKVIAMIVLTAFTVVSCPSPASDDGDGNPAGIPTVPIGKGTPRFVYLDADHEPAEEDSGRTLLYIEDNEAAEGVAVITEVPDNDPDNGTVVRVVNNNNQSVVSFFFRKNQPFPHQMAAQSEEGTVTGNFSLYDPAGEWYSIRFEKEGEGSCGLKKIYLNKEFFQVYENQSNLSESQNTRLRHTVTALGVWDSIALQIPGKKFLVTERHPGSQWEDGEAAWFEKAARDVFQAVPVVVFGASVVRCSPEAIIKTFQTESIGMYPISTNPSIFYPIPTIPDHALLIPMAATGGYPGAEAISAALPETFPSPAPPISPYVTIAVQDAAQNNGIPYDLPAVGETLVIDLQFSDGYPVTNEDYPTVNLFDPYPDRMVYSDFGGIVSVAKSGVTADQCLLTIIKEADGYMRDGAVQAVIRFGCDMVINDSDAGVDFVSDIDTKVPEHRKDVFIININTKPPATTG